MIGICWVSNSHLFSLSLGLVMETWIFQSRSRYWDLDIFSLGLVIETQNFQSRSCHWDSHICSLGLFIETHIFSVSASISWLRLGYFSLDLVIETQTFSVSVSLLRLRHFQSRSRWSKSGLADPWDKLDISNVQVQCPGFMCRLEFLKFNARFNVQGWSASSSIL